MNADPNEPTGRPSSRVQDPETGMLELVREWNDLFPWLRLLRTLRMAGSPLLVLLTFVWLGIWWLGQWMMVGNGLPSSGSDWGGQWLGASSGPVQQVSRLAFVTSPSTVYQLPARDAGWRLLIGCVWSLLVWTPWALLLMRQGALLTAGRPMIGLGSGLRLSLQRMLRAWLVALVPLVCVAAIGVLLFALGKFAQLIAGIQALDILAALVLVLIAIPCGLLAFGSHFAIPLGWAAIVNEPHPDPLDSLSRGYEYFLRRPIHLVGYLLLSLVLIVVIGMLAAGVAGAAASVTVAVLGTAGEGDAAAVVRRVVTVLRWFPAAVMVTLAWGLIGGVYLLLRRDAGGQEVEDVWIPASDPKPPLPSLPQS